jgi:5-methyltetrahydropteroyltriglutamate--homocysteine methyltransferase
MEGKPVNALRADHVGSLVRPSGLLQARVDFSAGRLDRDGLRAEEDRAIREALQRQRDLGLDVRSDGEFRRAASTAGFLAALEGFVTCNPEVPAGQGGAEEWPGRTGRCGVVTARLRSRGRIAQEEAAFLREHAGGPFKVTLPSSLLLAQLAYRPEVSEHAYGTREELVADAGAILAEEAGALAAEGVPYLQLDAPGYARWTDPALVARDREAGVDPERLLDAAVDADNRVLEAACPGGAWSGRLADGIAERLLTRLRCDRLLLGCDAPEAGGFRPLRFVPPRMVVTLGLISTKTGELERPDELLRRIDQASRVIPLERLALGPRCGFASSQVGSPLTEEQQWRKLALVAQVAREVWP